MVVPDRHRVVGPEHFVEYISNVSGERIVNVGIVSRLTVIEKRRLMARSSSGAFCAHQHQAIDGFRLRCANPLLREFGWASIFRLLKLPMNERKQRLLSVVQIACGGAIKIARSTSSR